MDRDRWNDWNTMRDFPHFTSEDAERLLQTSMRSSSLDRVELIKNAASALVIVVAFVVVAAWPVEDLLLRNAAMGVVFGALVSWRIIAANSYNKTKQENLRHLTEYGKHLSEKIIESQENYVEFIPLIGKHYGDREQQARLTMKHCEASEQRRRDDNIRELQLGITAERDKDRRALAHRLLTLTAGMNGRELTPAEAEKAAKFILAQVEMDLHVNRN